MSSLILSVFESYENVSSFFILDTSQCFLIISISYSKTLWNTYDEKKLQFWSFFENVGTQNEDLQAVSCSHFANFPLDISKTDGTYKV